MGNNWIQVKFLGYWMSAYLTDIRDDGVLAEISSDGPTRFFPNGNWGLLW